MYTKYIIFIVILLILSSCVYSNKISLYNNSDTIVEISSNSYFYYILSQLENKNNNYKDAEKYLKKALQLDPTSFYLSKELTNIYISQKKYELSLKIIEKIIEQQPNNIDALLIYGKLKQYLKHDKNEIINCYKRILTLEPFREKIYLIIGSLYNNSNIKEAKKIYESLIKNITNSFAGHFYLGKIYINQKDYDKAVIQFKKTIDLAPDLIEPRFELIKIYKINNNINKIINIYKEILKYDSLNKIALIEMAYYYSQSDNKTDAEKYSKEMAILIENNNDFFLEIAQFIVENKKFTQATPFLEGIIKYLPEDSFIRYITGICYDNLKKYNLSLKHLLLIKSDSEYYEKAALLISFYFNKNKKYQKAISHLEKVHVFNPRNTEIILYLASFYEQINKFEKAIDIINEELNIKNNNSKLHFRIGVIYDKLGKKQLLYKSMKKVIELDPKNANALNYLGYSYADSGINLDIAENLIKKALEFKPNDGYITDSLGWVYYKKGNFNEALRFLEKANTLVPNDPTLLEHLGDVYAKIDNTEKAIEFYKRSLKISKEKVKLGNKIKELSISN